MTAESSRPPTRAAARRGRGFTGSIRQDVAAEGHPVARAAPAEAPRGEAPRFGRSIVPGKEGAHEWRYETKF